MQHRPYSLSVKALIANAAGDVLVLQRSWKSKNHAGLWDLPGGKCDAGEAIDVALRREVSEETGLDVHVASVIASAQSEMPERVVAYLFFECSASSATVRLSDEHEEYRWVPRHQLAELAVPKQFVGVLKSYASTKAAGKQPLQFQKDRYHQQVEEFKRIRPQYEQLAQVLTRVFQDGTNRLGMHAIVQARAKTIASFAEKIFRKNYADPFKQMTDLCGARVITHTLSQVAQVCRFVEESFTIYPQDSGDKLDMLANAEFGYLSHHYVLSLKPGVFPEDVVPPDLIGKEFKAELQVRTILQHAWADINHELGYKNRFKLPRRWQREFARLAAVLEDADHDFDAIGAGLEEYAASYGSYLSQEKLRDEIAKLGSVLEVDPQNVEIAQKVAKMAMSLEDWKLAVETLEPFASRNLAPLVRDLGVSLCKLHGREPNGAGFQRGQQYLERAVELDENDVDAWASLGGTWRKREGAASGDSQRRQFAQKAHECYRRGYEKDSGHPYALGNLIEYELAARPDLDLGTFFRPAIEAAIRRCRLHVDVAVNLPWAYFDLGKFHLLLGQPSEALRSYEAGIANSTAEFFIDAALASFNKLESIRESLPGFDKCRDMLRCGKVRFAGKANNRIS